MTLKMSPALEPARRYTLQAITDGGFPGAQILVAHGDEILWHEAFGHASLEPQTARMDLDTLIDVASLTKALVTSTLAALLVSEGKVSLDTPLSKMLPESRDTGKAGLTLMQLLAHAAGFPLYVPYFKDLVGRYGDFRSLPFADLRREIIGLILQEKLVAAPGSVQQYSDLDYILLGEALGRVAGPGLLDAFRSRVAVPLGLTAVYRPLPAESVPGSQFAATELCPWRGEVLQGAVHDDHAYLMGGVAGHAGLFATALDVYRICRAWMRAYQGRSDWLDTQTARAFWTRPSKEIENTWTLGWDTPTPGQSTSGTLFSPNSVGHLGFTGGSMWVDLEREFTVVLLTNRIHPLRSNLGIKKFRPVFHDLVMEGLLGNAAPAR